jgi:hypothetical protein
MHARTSEVENKPKTYSCSEEDLEQHIEDNDGLCLACGEWSEGGVEPDAEDYKCTDCGAMAVCGAEQAMLLGRLELSEEEEEDDDDDDDDDDDEGEEGEEEGIE